MNITVIKNSLALHQHAIFSHERKFMMIEIQPKANSTVIPVLLM